MELLFITPKACQSYFFTSCSSFETLPATEAEKKSEDLNCLCCSEHYADIKVSLMPNI